jgi:hypothetical protein
MKEGLNRYHLNMKHTLKWIDGNRRRLDEKGVILYKVPYTQKFAYYPVEISLYALGNFEMFFDTGEEIYKENFLKQLDWLVDNITIKKILECGNIGLFFHIINLIEFLGFMVWLKV